MELKDGMECKATLKLAHISADMALIGVQKHGDKNWWTDVISVEMAKDLFLGGKKMVAKKKAAKKKSTKKK